MLAAAPGRAQEFVVSHLAGPSVGGPGWVDGAGTNARFAFPYQVALDPAGNIYVADSGN